MAGAGALYSDVFNPLRHLPGWCWYADNPPFCSDNNEKQCNRGDDNEIYSNIFFDIIGAWIVIIICMTLIVLKVRQVERKLLQYTFESIAPAFGASWRPQGNPSHVASFTRTRATAWQSLL